MEKDIKIGDIVEVKSLPAAVIGIYVLGCKGLNFSGSTSTPTLHFKTEYLNGGLVQFLRFDTCKLLVSAPLLHWLYSARNR